MSSKLWLIVPAALAVAGCNTAFKHIGDDDPFLGESVKYNAAVHTINPDPVYPEGSAEPGESGDKGASAVRRYRSGTVRQPTAESSTSGPR
jgi:hypothetical protein